MKKIKAQQLTQLLKPSERKEFSAYLHEHKRPSLAVLFDSISANGKKSETARWFENAFGETYTEEKDYLLRNELRHLSHELTRYLAQKELAQATNGQAGTQTLLYLKAVLNRNGHELFASEAPRMLKAVRQQSDPDTDYRILLQQIDHTFLNAETTPANYHQLLGQVDEAMNALKDYFELGYLQLARKRATLQRTLQAMGQPVEVDEVQSIHFNWKAANELPPNQAFLLLQAQATASNGEEKIALLKQAASLVSQLDFNGVDPALEASSCAAAIALEYFLMGDYEASMPYHQQALSYSDKLPDNRIQPFLFNFLATLIRMERYEDAVALLNEHAPVWLRSKRLKDRTLCMKAMCHLFMHQPEEAANCLPHNLKDSGLDHYYYYRVIQILVYFKRGDLLLALNEAENFLDTIKYQSVDDDHQELVVLLRKLFKLQNEQVALPRDKYDAQLQTLRDEYQQLMTSKAHTHNFLLYKYVATVVE